MTTFRILVVDDEPDIRKVVERSLARDPALTIRCCNSGTEALTEATLWRPHLILLDLMMPHMDGPSTLGRLRENPATSAIPVIFLTAHARSQELDYMASLGAAGSIAKPFHPKALREAVRGYLPPSAADDGAASDEALEAATAQEREAFRARLRCDGETLNRYGARLQNGTSAPADLGEIWMIVHKLAGAGGILGFDQVSRSAAALEQSIVDVHVGERNPDAIAGELLAFAAAIERE